MRSRANVRSMKRRRSTSILLATGLSVLACEAPKKTAAPPPANVAAAPPSRQEVPVQPAPTPTPAANEALRVAADGARPIEERRAAVQKLAALHESATIMPLFGLLDGNEGIAGVEPEARAALAELDALTFLKQRLESGSPVVRQQVPGLSAKLQDPRAVEILIPRMEDADPKVRENVAASLGLLRDPRALPSLVNHLAEPTAEVRSACAQSLGAIGGPVAIAALEGALKTEKDEFVRIFVEQGLAAAKGAR